MNYDQPEFQSKESRLQLELASWIHQSHLWEKHDILRGYMVCHWCGEKLDCKGSITAESSVCPENPKIKEMRRLWVENTIEAINKAEKTIKKSREKLKEAFMSGGIEYGKTIEKKSKG